MCTSFSCWYTDGIYVHVCSLRNCRQSLPPLAGEQEGRARACKKDKGEKTRSFSAQQALGLPKPGPIRLRGWLFYPDDGYLPDLTK